jgi:hypothetical protein
MPEPLVAEGEGVCQPCFTKSAEEPTSLPSVGTEDDRLCMGPRRGFDKSYAPRHAMLYYIL